ncbi:oxygen-independent coproporphyrinogen III oxidase [Bacillus sp. H-16]|uniref:radical SAM family heme chaperone HemW n=1 Tax=Alteribacter salitolerans TaxID=2912333 RepID=UPI00196656B1|nr:radical SAM family heme chaperone HemW [Alteribacter salitolerans]MBM7097123.1 oxygen-independent coproporphyrinogen III oxidase [Alteribacter salitolerans]
MKPKAVYVHVPFCEQICHYCDFNKFFLKNQPVTEYLMDCDTEMERTVETFPYDIIQSVYVGGGTPTSLSTNQLQTLLRSVRTHFNIKEPESIEFTVEVNPGSADEEKLTMMRREGANRLSIGVQTFDEGLLEKIGRDHKPDDVQETIDRSRRAGFENISIDLMFGLPGQTIEQFEETLERALALNIEHVSAYSLKVEAKTVFYQLMKKGKLPLPTEDTEADMYERLIEKLTGGGFTMYEISNFAKPGRESRHNLTYWENEQYYGIGAGAHSYINGVRRRNHGPLSKYMNAIQEGQLPYLEEHTVPVKEQMEEEMFMGLRKRIGVSMARFEEKYGCTMESVFGGTIDQLKKRELVTINQGRIQLTEKGRFLGNEVFEQFLLQR